MVKPALSAIVLILLLPHFVLYAEDSLTIKSRYISESEENMGLVLDLPSLQGGFLFAHQGAEEYCFTGGLAASYVKAGTLSLRGPLQELVSPSAASPSGDLFFSRPGSSLLRSWDSSTRVSAVLVAPGKAMLSVTSGEDGMPETGIEFVADPLPGLSLAAAAAYAELSSGDSDDWYLCRGVPPSGEILQTGLRAEAGGRRFKFSFFAAASLHRILPPGYYLRALAGCKTRVVDTGFRISWTSMDYRTPRHPWPPFHYNVAYEARLFPLSRISPFFDIRGELKQPEAGLPVEADRSLSGIMGCSFESLDWKADISRKIDLEMEEGEWSGDEIVRSELYSPDFLPRADLEIRLNTEAAWLIAPQIWSSLLNVRAGMILAFPPLSFSLSASRNREQETGEAPENPDLNIFGMVGWDTAGFSLEASLEYSAGSYSFSIKGAKKFEISLINIKNS